MMLLKRLNMMNWLKKLIILILLILSEIENKINDHDYTKYITTEEFNKLTSENVTARLAQTNLATKNDIVNFAKRTVFDDKLKKKKNYFK